MSPDRVTIIYDPDGGPAGARHQNIELIRSRARVAAANFVTVEVQAEGDGKAEINTNANHIGVTAGAQASTQIYQKLCERACLEFGNMC